MYKRRHRAANLTKSQQMALVRSKHTAPELALRKALWARGLRYRLHHKLPGSPDISFIGQRVAVFVDGCFWHGCPDHYSRPRTNCEYWDAKLRRNIARDAEAQRKLHDLGWCAVRIWEHDLRRHPARIVDRIASLVSDRTQPCRPTQSHSRNRETIY